jgi:hypothetical protein
LPNATSEPVKVTAPMRAVRAAATASWSSTLPRSTTSRNVAPATSTEAAPPKPLNSATNSGMPVIWTFMASRAPTTAPTATPAARKRKSTMARSRRVTTTATNMPVAPSRLPRAAVRGRPRDLRPRMNRTAAAR